MWLFWHFLAAASALPGNVRLLTKQLENDSPLEWGSVAGRGIRSAAAGNHESRVGTGENREKRNPSYDSRIKG